MEILNTWHIGSKLKSKKRIFVSGVLLSLCLFQDACVTSKKQNATPEVITSVTAGIPDPVFGPQALPSPEVLVSPLPSAAVPVAAVSDLPKPENFVGPTSISLRPATVFFRDAGGISSFGVLGALKVLKYEKIPIKTIISSGVGAAMAAVYALDASLNTLEWKIKKLKREDILPEVGLFDRITKNREPKNLEKRLSEWFGEKDIQSLKIPFATLISNGQKTQILDQGQVKNAVLLAVGTDGPDGFSPKLESGSLFYGADLSQEGALQALNQLDPNGTSPLIIFDFTSVAAAQPREEQGVKQLSKAHVWIRSNGENIDLKDFSKRNEAVNAAEAATNEKLKEIRAIVGLPEADTVNTEGSGPDD